MKNYFLILFLLVSFSACRKDNTDRVFVNLTSTQWYISKDGGNFVSLHLKIAGNTNGDKVTIKTIGDGLNADLALDLTANKTFNQDVAIAFTAGGASPGAFNISTQIMTHKGSAIKITTLNSGVINY